MGSAGRPGGAHGFPSVSPEMRTVLCAAGAGIAPRRLPTARTIDVAPTVSAWLGMAPPADAVGRSRPMADARLADANLKLVRIQVARAQVTIAPR